MYKKIIDINSIMRMNDRESMIFSFRYLECHYTCINIRTLLMFDNILKNTNKSYILDKIVRYLIKYYDEKVFSYLCSILSHTYRLIVLNKCLQYKNRITSNHIINNYHIEDSDIEEKHKELYEYIVHRNR
jgi:hypothetical protein